MTINKKHIGLGIGAVVVVAGVIVWLSGGFSAGKHQGPGKPQAARAERAHTVTRQGAAGGQARGRRRPRPWRRSCQSHGQSRPEGDREEGLRAQHPADRLRGVPLRAGRGEGRSIRDRRPDEDGGGPGRRPGQDAAPDGRGPVRPDDAGGCAAGRRRQGRQREGTPGPEGPGGRRSGRHPFRRLRRGQGGVPGGAHGGGSRPAGEEPAGGHRFGAGEIPRLREGQAGIGHPRRDAGRMEVQAGGCGCPAAPGQDRPGAREVPRGQAGIQQGGTGDGRARDADGAGRLRRPCSRKSSSTSSSTG